MGAHEGMAMNMTVYMTANPGNRGSLGPLCQAVRQAAPEVQILAWAGPLVGCGPAFSFCTAACRSADLVVCCGHRGQAIGIQAGMAHGAGTPVLGIPEGGVPSPMMDGCVSRWVKDRTAVPALIARLQRCLSRIESRCPEAEACPRCDLKSLCRYFSFMAGEEKEGAT